VEDNGRGTPEGKKGEEIEEGKNSFL